MSDSQRLANPSETHRFIIRFYTISSAPDGRHYRITVKKLSQVRAATIRIKALPLIVIMASSS
jgi:ferredoxin-NADP reductase